jgi:hypothetical protein
VCGGLLLATAGCDPAAERRYITEGGGVDLYTADRQSQVELQKQYIDFVCDQAGPQCGGNWTLFVQAGMNDIDQRCDGFLTWLDARRRDKEPILAELSALNTTAHTIMAISGASPKSLDIVTAAFGLATATYNNWNSRLLLSINQSTVQEVVYTSQGKFREKIKSFPINDQPTAIYLLRNYLRLCMPTTIEAAVNISTTLVQREAPPEAQENLVVASVKSSSPVRIQTTFRSDNATKALEDWLRPNGVLNNDRVKIINDFLVEKQLSPKPFVTTFLKTAKYESERLELARRLKLVP